MSLLLHIRLEAGVDNFDVDLGADDSGAGLGKADLGLHQFVFQAGEFVGGYRHARGASGRSAVGLGGIGVSYVHGM